MPRTTRLSAYGPEYEQLLLRASAIGHLPLTLPSEKHAKALRSKLYVYFTSLRREGSRPDLVAKADALALTVDGTTLSLGQASDSWDAVAIRSNLGITKDTPLPDAPAAPSLQDALRDKLTALRAKNVAKL